ncbi:MAG TPA: winged helix-turn-helix domain-containing protein, partial [Candidatus Thermoplasmatota archaeon]|nr:winged helix-turn-helix domain-containing protein [Candidatus Thermoplasmatota archaeon]
DAVLSEAWPPAEGQEIKPGDRVTLARYAWRGPERVRLGDGALHDVNVLDVHHAAPSQDDDGRFWWDFQRYAALLAPGDGSLVGTRANATSLDAVGVSAGPHLWVGSEASSVGPTTWFHDGLPHCLATLPARLEGDRLLLSRPCQVPGFGLLPEGVYERGRTQTILGLEATEWRAPAATEGRKGAQASVWLAAPLPAPLRVHLPQGFVPAVTLELSGWSPGTSPLAAADHVEPAPPPVFASRTPWLLDDTGTTHAFPLSQAWQGAVADPGWPFLAAFLVRHPDAYVASARYVDMADELGHESGWRIIAWGGGEALHFEAMRRDLPGATGPAPATHRLIVDPLPHERPASHLLPDDLPMLTSLEEAWGRFRADAGKDALATGWGIEVTCASRECEQAVARFTVGEAQQIGTRQGGPAIGPASPFFWEALSYDGALLVADASGQVLAVAELDGSTGRAMHAGRPEAASAAAIAPAPLAASALAPPTAAAAVTLVAAASAAVAYFWPMLKAGAAALFSRVEGPALLRHPTRARIHALVEARPGIHFQGILRELSLARGVAGHHIAKLVSSGLLVCTHAHGMACYTAKGTPPAQARIRAALHSGGARRLLQAIRAQPGTNLVQAGRSAGISPATAHRHMRSLHDAGLVIPRRFGREVRLDATELADGALRGPA